MPMLHLVGSIKRIEVLSCDATTINKPSSKSLGPFIEKVIKAIMKHPDKQCQIIFTGGKKCIELAVDRINDCLCDLAEQNNQLIRILEESFEIKDGQTPRQKDTHCYIVSYYCETAAQKKKRIEENSDPN